MKRKRIENFLYSKFMSFIIIFIILLSFCYTSKVIMLENCINWICLFFSLIIIIFYLLNCEISKICLALILYCVFLFISTLLGDKSSLTLFFTTYYKIISLSFYLDYGLKYYCKNIVRSFYMTYFILILFNFYTIIRYPMGWYSSELYENNWFFKYDNMHIFMYLPALLFIYIEQKIFNRKTKVLDYLLFFVIAYCIFFCFSATSVVGYFILLIYLLFKKYVDKLDIFNSKTYFITYFITFLSFVILRIQEIFSFIIVKLLKKNLTFSGRTLIWDNTVELIKKRVFIGYGKEETKLVASKLGDKTFTHAHNTILDVLYKGGIIGFIMFIIILFLSVNELYKYRKNDLTKFMSVILFCFFVMMNFEARQENIGLYIVLICCFNVGYILKNINKDDKKLVNIYS